MAIRVDRSVQGTALYADGRRFIILTPETPYQAVNKFILLAEQDATELAMLTRSVEQAREFNRRRPSDAKNWPSFGKLERKINMLCKQAGVVDT